MDTKDWISTKDRMPETNNKIDNYTNCSDEFLREYCSNLEHNNPRARWNEQLRK